MKFLIAALLVVWSIQSVAKEVWSEKDTVEYCVGIARYADDGFGGAFSKNFDAFVNPIDGSVQNNAFRVGDQQAWFAFQKCMAASGYPLSTSK